MTVAFVILFILFLISSAVYLISLMKLTDRISRDKKQFEMGIQIVKQRTITSLTEDFKHQVEMARIDAESKGFDKGKQYTLDWIKSKVDSGELSVQVLHKQ